MDNSNPIWTRISKWWTLIVVGVVVLLVGLATDNFKAEMLGAVLLIIGVAGEGYNLLDVDLSRGRIRLKRETVQEAMVNNALERGIPLAEARGYAQAVTADFPEEGAPVKANGPGAVEAKLSDSSHIIFRRPPGKKLTEEGLAEELADSQSEDLQRKLKARKTFIPELSRQVGDLRQVHTVQSDSTTTADQDPISPAFGLLEGLQGDLDHGKRFLVYSTGEHSLRTFEIKPGSRVLIGRSEGNDLSLIGPQVSRIHALLEAPADDAPAIINNLASTHGIYVNGEKVEGQPLHDRDFIGIGDFDLLYIGPPS